MAGSDYPKGTSVPDRVCGRGVGRIMIGFGERLDLIFKVIGKLPEGT